MIFAYNKEHVGDVLLVIFQDTKDVKRSVERKGKIGRVYLDETGETLAWNIFDVSTLIDIEGQGQVFLTDEQLAVLNAELAKEGFDQVLENDNSPKFVVAEIVEMVDHPDSDHLHICQVEINDGQRVQIVCGAPNAAQGLKTVAALPGAMMPSGSLIFPGKLRGEDSFGMLCSARELELPNAPQVRGIIELSDDVVVGERFDASKHWTA
ncbi:YtpR family tRNA-binding protein [Streptococcus loxodontisalivarius]|uniref:tRNA-binding protein n=1 Tax=Streptococcus loxodontisalivarius TaxID=1349415 RepID=A0ABS2PVR6_9STRE|nr:DUF4479 and tRNA-binding domain-containing protein [Streptococcus loxodontisalivarius]MBM7643549.1 tRNA-binding protein [Streptococcus loxodontisalivarius]